MKSRDFLIRAIKKLAMKAPPPGPMRPRTQHSWDTLRQSCHDRKIRLTDHRERILRILYQAHRPLSAYDIIAALAHDRKKPVGPPSVYRVLELLVDKALLVRLESRNAYILCHHPDCDHDHILFSCRQCGRTWEGADTRTRDLLNHYAAHIHFTIERQILELSGLCADCRGDKA